VVYFVYLTINLFLTFQFYTIHFDQSIGKQGEDNRMESIIAKENMRVRQDAADWKDAIRLAGAVLEEKGSITSAYTDAMIAAVEELGPYMVIMPGFAIAHAAPSPAVLKEDLSLITLKEPVKFGSPNDPVGVVLCVACVDRESHVKALQRVAVALLEEDVFDRMAEAETVDALYDILHAGA